MTRAFDDDHYDSFDDLEEAVQWARESAEAAGMAFLVAHCGDEYRAGPVDEVDIIAGADLVEIEAVFDADGNPSQLLESMFSDPTDPDEVVSRLSGPVREAQAEARPVANEARSQRAFAARSWRRDHLAILERCNTLAEMEVEHRRSVYTRRKALIKKKTVMDKDRRRVARNAHNWRLRNKSKAKRYGSLYHGPHSKVKEASVDAGEEWHDVVVDRYTGEIMREATQSEIEAAIAQGDVIVERRRRPVGGAA